MKIAKKIFSIFLRIAITVALLVFLFKQVDERAMLAVIRKADKGLLLAACAIFSLTYILCLYRWQMLLKAAKLDLPLTRVIISFSGGIFFSLFLPSSIGGDFMRSIDLALHTKKPRQVVATVLLDRLSGYIALVVLTLAALFLGRGLIHNKSVVLSVALLTAILIVVLLVLFNSYVYSKVNQLLHSPRAGRIRRAIKNIHQEINQFGVHRGVIARNIAVSLIAQTITPITFYLIALALGVRLKMVYFFIFLPIIGAVTLLPISIGGLGIRDTLTVFFFGQVGMVKDTAFAMSLLSFSFILLYGILGGLIYVFTIHHRRVQYHQTQTVCQNPQNAP
jgi:glycosyltransferase 2 family protein